ncbi:hypothetical protein E0H26_04710 [Micromonospora zingiberis]|uniref:DUF3533 domain-containing protein n=1 Tax=Micromonospora zingiberis TaxID=2053011 RepID=A0A4R0GV65_9ACTN|nr:hypothetical protein [Micromonospora zingiberis]TCB99849.1 hypothetical protein E0H26_04710 [Micromonospora zingiberis]
MAEDSPVREWLPRTAALLVGTLILASAFIAAYVGALHAPNPRDIPVGVVRGDQAAQTLLAAVRQHTDTIKAISYADPAAAEAALNGRDVYATLATAGDGALALTLASASAPAATDVVQRVITTAGQQAGVRIQVTDQVPVSPEDPRGLAPFYLAIGFVLGGYLASTVLGISLGTAPAGLRGAGLRIAALAVHAVLLGIAGAVLVGPVLGVWHDHVLAIAGVGALAAFAATMVAAAVQGWLGLFGTGLVILLLVVLGNPGSGGVYAPEFLPSALRGMHRWNVPGLATDLVKSAVYFDGRAIRWPLTGLVIWVAAGIVGLITATLVRGRHVVGSPGRHRSPDQH